VTGDPLPILAVRLGAVTAADDVLNRLEADRDASLVEWRSRPLAGDTAAGRLESAFFSATHDVREFEGFDQYVGGPVERAFDYMVTAYRRCREAINDFRYNPADRRRRSILTAHLSACAVATEAVRGHTAVAVNLYHYHAARASSGQLQQIATRMTNRITAPVLEACEAVLAGAPLPALATALHAMSTPISEMREIVEGFGRAAKAGVEISTRVMAVLAAAELTYSVYHAGLALGGGGGGPRPPRAPSVAMVRGGALVRAPALVFDIEALLRLLAVVGGFGLHAAMAKLGDDTPSVPGNGGAATSSAPGGGEDPDDNFGGTSNFGVGRPPRPAPDDLYSNPTPRQLASWQRQLAAFAASTAGQTSQVIMRRLGYFAMRTIYPQMIRIVRGGRGLAFFGGTVDKAFIESLRGQTQRALFVETTVRWGGRNVRVDAFEVTFRTSKDGIDLEIVDLTTSLRTSHLFKTEGYAKIFEALGFRVKAADIILTDGVKMLDEFVVKQVVP
jgi:hypothetical protein